MEISIKWNICRICLQEEPKNVNDSISNEQMRNIFDEGKKLTQHIYEFSGIIIKPNDSLPDKICPECLKKINSAVQFRKTCRASNTYLQSVLQRARSASSLFKQDIPTSEISDDEFGKEKPVEAENEIGNSKVDNCKGVRLHDSNKPPAPEGKGNPNFEDFEHGRNVTQQEVVSDNVELEEIIEQSEDITEQICSQTIEDSSEERNLIMKHLKGENKEDSNKNEDHINPKTSELHKFYMNTNISNTEGEQNDNDRDLAENEENETSDMKVNNDELYYVIKDIKNENSNSTDNHEDKEEPEKEQQAMADENMEYYSIEEEEEEGEEINKDLEEEIDEELMFYLEHEVDDNQAQVSSTVDTNDEIECDEQNSEASNMLSELNEEYIVDDNLDTYSSSSSKSYTYKESTASKPNAIKVQKVREISRSAKERNSPVIFPRRKIKRNHAQSNNSSAAPRLVCVCEICGNQFTNRNLMNVHMKVHYQEKNHQCEICSKRFITASNLQAHMRIHTGEKPFECKYCGRRFNDRSSNLRHERTHTNEKPFKCDDCGKTFTLATTLQNHMKVHTNERSYRCEPCGKSFKLVHHLKTHQNTSLHRSVLGIEEFQKI